MNLYEYAKNHVDEYGEFDEDTYDNVFDMVVTVVMEPKEIEKSKDDYDVFIRTISKRVEFLNEDMVIGWSALIQNHMEAFRKWTRKNWVTGNYRDDDDYICEWVEQIHLLFAGYGTDTDYRVISEFLQQEIPEV